MEVKEICKSRKRHVALEINGGNKDRTDGGVEGGVDDDGAMVERSSLRFNNDVNRSGDVDSSNSGGNDDDGSGGCGTNGDVDVVILIVSSEMTMVSAMTVVVKVLVGKTVTMAVEIVV
ncbi:hypothetical protein [Arabidopsis thaliana]|uniref:Uncharacterized protein F18L15.100 n=1 Tax=Arabidopsis thaliana TaxID=3702 RepID=Q9SN99_ARATH|nr:uncharacterized protein AT3G46380 [Arabidopsis thaliana]AEE78152.1 hypothetical protein AT3G46380 [Arabidopsis thaliana]CAB62029.1 hypothetical protein [Arabidopsis thaliana]|eukprot:NP_190222.1 hypothetical protein AT3G46380 [Arabidopsis thaliana]